MNTITKERFIKKASKLENFYPGSDIAVYAYARDCDCIDSVFVFMSEKQRTVGQVTEYIYKQDRQPDLQNLQIVQIAQAKHLVV